VTKVGLDDHLVAGATTGDLAALPRLEWWPPLAPHALHGPAGRIVETLAPYTETDTVAILAHLLVGIGNLIGPGPTPWSAASGIRSDSTQRWWGSRAGHARAPPGPRAVTC
jgi:hypothetical protein